MEHPQQDFTTVFENKFQQIGIEVVMEDHPLAEPFEQYASDLINSWVALAVMNEDSEAFLMMMYEISKMRKLDIFGAVAMAISGQGYNPFGENIPPELDAIMSVVHETPSLELVIETFNTLEHGEVAYLEEKIVKFKA